MRSRLCFALVALAFGSVPAGADPLQDIAQCAQISSGELRLICYDAAARGLGATSPTSPAPPTAPAEAAAQPAPEVAASVSVPSAPVTAAAPATKKSGGWMFGLFGGGKKEAEVATAQSAPAAPLTPEASFGANRLPKTESAADKPKSVSSIRSAITDYAYTPFDRIIVFLENGQVWRQIDGDSKKLRLRKGETYTAEIDKGAFGSFNLAVDGIDGMVKVTRIK